MIGSVSARRVVCLRVFPVIRSSLVILACVCGASLRVNAEAPRAVVCLHTELFPIEGEGPKYRLMRELGRQAVLMAARDELGIGTRDETLGEVFPDSVVEAKQDLFVAVRSQFNGDARVQLWAASKPETPEPSKKEGKHDASALVRQVEKLEAMVRGDLAGRLRALGFEGKVPPPDSEVRLPDEIEGQLLEMNYVSAFSLVRAGHAAIAEKGQSDAWLGALARGYANLALLTEHHWKSDTDVFASRALLYAERLAAAHPDDAMALANRAYVRAIVGLHGPALDDVKRIKELREQKPGQAAMPGWYELVEPYCSFQREAVTGMIAQRKSLRELGQRLSFEQTRAFGDPRWMFDCAKQTLTICPEDYGVYAALTTGHAPLAVGRTGAYYAPGAFAHFMPSRVAKLPGIPVAVLDATQGRVAKQGEGGSEAKAGDEHKDKADEPADSASAGEFAAATIPIVDALRAATRSGDDRGEPSWSALGEMIFEEQFVQAANFLNIAMNATESSHDEEVRSMLRAIKGHRYERHIQSYAPAVFNQAAINIIGDMPIIDARGNMRPMILRLWTVDSQHGNKRGTDAAWYAMFDTGLTFNGLEEAYGAMAQYWRARFDAVANQQWADDYKTVSPHSPQALRMAMPLVPQPAIEQLTEWEAAAGEDPVVFARLGAEFAKLERYEDATRCFERSIQLSPNKDAYVGLANAYRALGQDDQWLPTLERFFKVESLGLEHAQVHAIIANDFIDKHKWEEAEPHAIEAGNTYSNWGLLLASQVAEVLGHWDESEKWISAAAQSYPSSSGAAWYFWCRRTGRGHVDDARKLADVYFRNGAAKNDVNVPLRLLTFHLCENDARAASEDMKEILRRAAGAETADEDMVRAHANAAMIARELKESDAEHAAIKEARRLCDNFREKSADLNTIYVGICDVLEGKAPTGDALTAVEQAIERQPNAQIKINCLYFLGRAYDLAGNSDQADKYWRPVVAHGPYDRYPATLAGKYLSDRHTTSRESPEVTQ